MNEFLSPSALADFGIAMSIVVLLTNTVVRATVAWPKVAEYRLLIALVLSLAIVFAGQGLPQTVSGWFTAVANGALLFGAALASNQLIAAAVASAAEARLMRSDRTSRRDDVLVFWTPWVRTK